MASSSLCGPSNALQNLQKHAQADRTLQQDRISGNASQSLETFRSSPGPSQGILDAEYDAFQASAGPAFQSDPFQFGPPMMMNTPQVPDWASDFQRLHVSHSPSPPPQLMAPVPQQPNWLSGWHNEFMQEQPVLAPSPQVQQNAFGQSFGHFGNSNYGMQNSGFFGNSMFGNNAFAQSAPVQQDAPLFDDAAFEAAFAAASVEVATPNEPISNDQWVESFMHEQVQEPLEPMEEPMQSVEEQHELTPTDQDELARTAGRLLESVKDDSSQKFQESTFLALMRRIRDREVTVEGDKMVETTPSPPPQPRFTAVQEPWMEKSWDSYVGYVQ